MSSKVNSTFAAQLRHFAKSVDIVSDSIFDRVRELVHKYVQTELGAEYFELMREQPIDREPGLKMFWSSEDRDHLWRISGDDGGHKLAVTKAFDLDRPMWIVSGDGSPLAESTELVDQWSRLTDLPPYQPIVDQAIRTCVVVPLRRRHVHGVYYFESCMHLGVTDVAKAELQMLGDALGILLELYETGRSQARLTTEAIIELRENLESARFPKLTRPHFFVASSQRADRTVVRVIDEVLHEHHDTIDFTDWKHMSESGNISEQITREISRSRFGICYLSEPVDDAGRDKHRYRDNANVVFEAGMLHALTNANDARDGSEPAGWIPIRENDSPPAPFDFAAERTVYVPRWETGEMNEARLRDVLTTRVRKLLGS